METGKRWRKKPVEVDAIEADVLAFCDGAASIAANQISLK